MDGTSANGRTPRDVLHAPRSQASENQVLMKRVRVATELQP